MMSDNRIYYIVHTEGVATDTIHSSPHLLCMFLGMADGSLKCQ